MERSDGHERHDGHPHDGNRNGVIRRYLPKRSRIEPSMAADVQAIVDETNNRPMWVLGYRTPAEAFADELLELTTNKGVALLNRQRATGHLANLGLCCSKTLY